MDFLKDRRVLLVLADRRVQVVIGGALALAAGLALAVGLALRPDANEGPPHAAESGLVVQTGRDDVPMLNPARPLKCYVGGRLAGEMTVADCARKNGVATGALDVGVAPSGGLAAAAPTETTLPPPPPLTDADIAAGDAETASADQGGVAPFSGARACLSYSGGGWSRAPGATSLNACVQTLFSGQCVAPGAAVYGRWANKVLRLVLGRVEISDDGRDFRTLALQTGACAVPDLG